MCFISDDALRTVGTTFTPLKQILHFLYKMNIILQIHVTHASLAPFLNATQYGFESSARVAICLALRPNVLIVMFPPASSHHRLNCKINRSNICIYKLTKKY